MARWEATRPNSQTKGWAFTIVGCANIFDVQSSAPDTTTVGSFNATSAYTGMFVWRDWQSPLTIPSSYYEFGIRISCKSFGTGQYFVMEYSTDSGANWSSLISSIGGSNLAMTTITRSFASNFSVASLWIRLNQVGTTTSARGRAQISDIYMVGSYNESLERAIPDTVGITDNTFFIPPDQNYTRNPYDTEGISDGLSRKMDIIRFVVDG